MKAASSPSGAAGPGAIELIEESVHLLRTTPAATFSLYYAGSGAFVLGLLYFWAGTTWFAPDPGEIFFGAMGLAVLFGVMKACHAEFCARLMAACFRQPPPALGWARFGALAATQLRRHAAGLILLPVAAVLIVPFGWVYAYFQNLNVATDEAEGHREAMGQARLWPGQNFLSLAILAGVGLATAVNVGAAFWLVPKLANQLLAIDNLFALSGWWFANTTFLASVAGLTWLAIDPLVKAFYTLRMFHGKGRRTGEDLRIEIRAAPRRGLGLRAVVAIVVLLAWLAPSPSLVAASPASPPLVDKAELDRSIDQVLAGSEFQWRLRPLPADDSAQGEGLLSGLLRRTGAMIRRAGEAVGEWISDLVDWFLRWIMRGGRATAAMPAKTDTLRVMLFVFLATACGGIVYIILKIWERSRAYRRVVAGAVTPTVVPPDLNDESTQASQLAPEGWLGLAREQIGHGDWKLALRALYLATLARHAGAGLISLARFKTNLDYERELQRRAPGQPELRLRFSRRRGVFEAVWYGRMTAEETMVKGWLGELEGRDRS